MGERIKKLGRLGILIGIRQGWFLICNWYQLWREPYLTVKNIRKDKSQMALVAATALWPVWGYVVARVIWDLGKHGSILLITGNVFLASMGLQLGVIGYLSYWWWRTGRKNES